MASLGDVEPVYFDGDANSEAKYFFQFAQKEFYFNEIKLLLMPHSFI